MLPLVYFVRHGQTDWNAESRFQGQGETDLNDVGRKQADRNGAKLAELIGEPGIFDFVSSPMRRTRETMERVRAGMRLSPQDYRTDPRLIEVHFGDWTGFTVDELKRKDPDFRRADKWNIVPPGEGAESYQMLLERLRPWFQALKQPTVCVSHGGVLRAVFRLADGLDDDGAANLIIPQDRILRMKDGQLDWL